MHFRCCNSGNGMPEMGGGRLKDTFPGLFEAETRAFLGGSLLSLAASKGFPDVPLKSWGTARV